ncbi:carbohydrate ABC transporter permease [Mycetocola reblochoni]|uniref:N-Acetyl-D-glucosamine ABC transport system, permease protein 1 n=2 Tax=Mycetocola reblochoni TaxID=331618 RepID=A0A1R4J0A2_9MICO|nr:sugar ABC transporter permease [Mycetocola reblochoni]SJN25073.1 N-Acetyl-D-glucosamine ABC transport system, permease protein 1 [Mycetocola reblochoni REB411]
MTQATALTGAPPAGTPASAGAARPVPTRRVGAQRDWAFRLMVFPAVFLFTVFLIVPTLIGVFFSFTSYAGFGEWEFVGLGNYVALFTDPNIWAPYGFTFFLAIVCVVVVNVLAMAIALGLNANIKWRTPIRTVFFIPMVLSALVVAYVFTFLFNSTLPMIADSLGLVPLATTMLADASTAWIPIVFVTAWTSIPGTTLIYLAGLQAVPRELYEAASVDGASAWRQFRSITMPMLAVYLVINIILGFRGYLGAYDIIVAMTGGGPGISTMTVSMRIMGGLNGGDFAYQAANSLVFFVITLIISLVQLRVSRKGMSL